MCIEAGEDVAGVLGQIVKSRGLTAQVGASHGYMGDPRRVTGWWVTGWVTGGVTR